MNLPELPALPMNDPAAAHKVMYEYGKACAKQAGLWQPAETAPKDGTEFLAAMQPQEQPLIVVWSGSRKLWIGANLYFNSQENYAYETLCFYPYELKAWQPLPDIPEPKDD